MISNRPLALVDLDDTLFQTARKMVDGIGFHPASFDVNHQVSGYMSDVQKSFVEWLLATTDVVPVTARSAEAFGRVRLGFTRGAVCSHGAVILDGDGTVNAEWHAKIGVLLSGFQDRLPALCANALEIGEQLDISLRGWVVEEGQQQHYVVIKHNTGVDTDLVRICEELKARGLIEGMHHHINGNNLALLPNGLAKRVAVEHVLNIDLAQNGARPVLGFGDSITDLGFMELCTFWSTPSGSQLARKVAGAVHG